MSEADKLTDLVFPQPVNTTHSVATDATVLCDANALAESKLPMNMELTQRENDLAGDTSSTRVEDIELLSTPTSVEQEMVAVIQALRSTNSKLLKRAMHLEQSLVECKKDLQTQQEQSQVLQTQLTEKIHELEAAQAQIKRLKQEEQINQETTQQQQILIEGLTVQLQASQERVNQLEREWLLTQATQKEQTYQLRQTECTCQELRNRLTRQQRYTMQLKVALEKCLDKQNPKSETEADSDRIFTYTATREEDTDAPYQAIFGQPQPIPPWSFHEIKPDAEESVAERLNTATESTQTKEATIDEALVDEQFPAVSAPLGQTPVQHDAVLNLLSDAPCTEAIPQIPVEDVELVAEMPCYDAVIADQSPDWLEATLVEASESPSVSSEDSVTELELEQLPAWEDGFFANLNWPSPVLYPSRSPKKRKTLAAIELPNFAHSR